MDEIMPYVTKAQVMWKRFDTEEKTMAVGAALCVLLLLGYVFRKCCCGRRSLPTEEEALKQVAPVIAVTLYRSGTEKLGMALRPTDDGSSSIIGIADGDLLDQWNRNEPCTERRIRTGDQIVSVTDSTGSCTTVGAAMTEKLKTGGTVSLTVAVVRTRQELEKLGQCISGMVVIDNLTLKDCAELVPPTLSSGGASLDRAAMQVASVGPALAAWNDQKRQEGACCTQLVEVGDRIVSISGSTNVRLGVGTSSPTLVVARFRPHGTFRVDSFDVSIQRQSAEDRMGMVICPHPMGDGPALVLALAENGAVARWNSSNRPICRGDKIVSVNGKTSYTAMQKELTSMSLSLRIERWAANDVPSGGYQTQAEGTTIWSPGAAQGLAAPMPAAPPVQSNAAALKTPGPPASAPQLGSVAMVALALMLSDDHPDWALAVRVGSLQMNKFLRMPLKQVPEESHASAAWFLMAGASVIMVKFVWSEVSMLKRPEDQRRLMPQLLLALTGSLCFGYGHFFLLAWAGVHA